jgi:hypothetical protein
MPPFVIPFSLWALFAAVGLFILQMLPGIGIVLMFLGAGPLTGVLVHVFLIGLFVQSITRRVPPFLVVVPITMYGLYYVDMGREASAIAGRAAELRALNSGQGLRFDPDTHSLVVENAGEVVQKYKIPVAYASASNSTPPGYRAFRLMRYDQCDIREGAAGAVRASAVVLDGARLCLLSLPEAPAHALVKVVQRYVHRAENRDWGISEQANDLIVDGKTIASYRTASVQRLPPLPIGWVGCLLIDNPSAVKCGIFFQRIHDLLDTTPEGTDRARYDTPVSVMLGIPKYTKLERADFRGFPQSDAVLARVGELRERADNEIIAVLDDIIAGKYPKSPVHFFAPALVQLADRLPPRAEGMAKRLSEMSEPWATNEPHRLVQMRVLESALSALLPDDFARVADAIFSSMRAELSREQWSILYVRAADAGASTFDFFKREFLASQIEQRSSLLPVLAICRIGQADAETVAEMKVRFVATKNRHALSQYRSALVVALLKLGQEVFLREQASVVDILQREWFKLVLDGQAATATGPNNCMPEKREFGAYIPPLMAPVLTQNANGLTVRPGP